MAAASRLEPAATCSEETGSPSCVVKALLDRRRSRTRPSDPCFSLRPLSRPGPPKASLRQATVSHCAALKGLSMPVCLNAAGRSSLAGRSDRRGVAPPPVLAIKTRVCPATGELIPFCLATPLTPACLFLFFSTSPTHSVSDSRLLVLAKWW
jgi:hypothetical protein